MKCIARTNRPYCAPADIRIGDDYVGHLLPTGSKRIARRTDMSNRSGLSGILSRCISKIWNSAVTMGVRWIPTVGMFPYVRLVGLRVATLTTPEQHH
jgi:hypothetical protein